MESYLHTGARHITIALNLEYNHGVLEILDDGVGIAARPDCWPGRGLHIMKYRCGLFDGGISIDPGDRGGTLQCCQFPLDAVAREGRWRAF